MCNGHAGRNPIFCVLPPYILDKIIENGTPEQREFALKTRSKDSTFRSMRVMAVAAPRKRTPQAVTRPRNISVFDSQHQQNLPGILVRGDGQPATGDQSVDEAYDGLLATYNFYAEVFGRSSIDDNGMPIVGSVHFSKNYNNAFWNSEQMVFGDGDGVLFRSFTSSIDVIGHELAHGVTEFDGPLFYFGQSGALNESMSDVFGSLIKQRVRNQTADAADWLIGEGILGPNIKGRALRSMKDPGSAFDDPILGKDPQPKHMDDFVNTVDDNGGVHINSGIPNHAFYLFASKLGGYAWEKAGKVWYRALSSSQLKGDSSFVAFAHITAEVTRDLFGKDSEEHRAILTAWKHVGVQTTISQLTLV